MKALYVGFLAFEAVVLAALWTVAISGFWHSFAVGLAACALSVFVTACVAFAARAGRGDLWR